MGEPISKKHLKKYLGWKMRVDSNKERIARAEHEAMWPTMGTSDGSQHQPGPGDRMERAIIRRMALEDKLQPIIEADEYRMEQIDEAINSLDDPFEQEVLTLRYIDGEWDDEEQRSSYRPMKWESVAVSMYGDDEEKHVKAATRLHGQALVSISKFIFEEEKSHP